MIQLCVWGIVCWFWLAKFDSVSLFERHNPVWKCDAELRCEEGQESSVLFLFTCIGSVERRLIVIIPFVWCYLSLVTRTLTRLRHRCVGQNLHAEQ